MCFPPPPSDTYTSLPLLCCKQKADKASVTYDAGVVLVGVVFTYIFILRMLYQAAVLAKVHKHNFNLICIVGR